MSPRLQVSSAALSLRLCILGTTIFTASDVAEVYREPEAHRLRLSRCVSPNHHDISKQGTLQHSRELHSSYHQASVKDYRGI
jgi:hypothetical protein